MVMYRSMTVAMVIYKFNDSIAMVMYGWMMLFTLGTLTVPLPFTQAASICW